MWRGRIRETSAELPQTFLVCQLLSTLNLHELLMLLGEERLGLLLLLEINLTLQVAFVRGTPAIELIPGKTDSAP